MTKHDENNIINLELTRAYSLSNDYLFKKVFYNKKYLKELLLLFFNINAHNITFLNTELLKSNKISKVGIADLLLKIDDDFIILEYQNINRFNFENRLLYYSSKLISHYGLQSNEDYKYLKKFKILALVNFDYLNNKDLNTVNLKYEKQLFTNNIEYRIASIKAISKDKKHLGYDLANLFTKSNLKDMHIHLTKKIYKEIFSQIKYFNLNEKEWLKMDEIAKLLMNEKENYSGAYEEGMSKGMSKGINQIVINMLENNLDIDTISKCSKLSKNKILDIKQEYLKTKVKS